MKVLVTGAKGQLGTDIMNYLKRTTTFQIIGIDISDVDITKFEEISKFILLNSPDIIIHCAAYTSVDLAEDNQSKCMEVNVLGTRNIVKIADSIDAKIVYISTDYVFDGTKNGYYENDDTPNPISIYGMSKYLGEIEVMNYKKFFIVRISWVFGLYGNNFVKTMLKLGREQSSVKVVGDQIGSPTYTKDLAVFLGALILTDKFGIYHATNEGTCSWYEFAKEIFKQKQMAVDLRQIQSTEYNTKARRPKNSLLSKSSLDEGLFSRLPIWQDALSRFLIELEEMK